MSRRRIPEDEWRTVVRTVPIVSVDLVVSCPDGVLLGKRTNRPAKGTWFVPGGRVYKNERIEDAVHRIADEELGVDVDIVGSLGVYEHFYDRSDVDGETGKHYLANGFVVETATPVCDVDADDQHSEVRAVDGDTLPEDVHEYTAAYLRDADHVETPNGYL